MHSDTYQKLNKQFQNRTHYRCAFTLVELTLVLLIMVMITTIIGANFSGFRQKQQKIDTAKHMLTLMQIARQQAISQGKTYRLNIDKEDKTFWLTTQDTASTEFTKPNINDNKTYVIPKNIEIIWDTPESIVENKYIIFYPDGSTQATCITLTDDNENEISLFNYALTTQFQIGTPNQEATYQEDEQALQIQ